MEFVIKEDVRLFKFSLIWEVIPPFRALMYDLIQSFFLPGTPESALSMLQFLQCVRERQAEMVEAIEGWSGHPLGPPIVVHCSAGIVNKYKS